MNPPTLNNINSFLNKNLGVPLPKSTIPVSPSVGMNSSNASMVPNMSMAPVNKTPNAGSVSSAKPLIIPTPTVSNTNDALKATTDSYMATPPASYDTSTGFVNSYGLSQGAKPVQPNDPANAPTDTNTGIGGTGNTRDSLLAKYLGLQNDIGGQAQVRNDLNTTLGVDKKQQNYIDSFNQYQSKKVSYDQQVERIYNEPGITREQATQQVGEISRRNNADLANMAVITQAAQGNYQAALDIVDRKIKAEFDPIQQQIDNLGKFLETNNADLTSSEKVALENTRFQLQTNMTNLISAKQNAHQFALQQGIQDPRVLQAIDNAQTPADVYTAVGGDANGLPGQNTQNGNEANLSQGAQRYVDHSSDGVPYVDQGRLQNMTPYQKQIASQEYAKAGIRVLDSNDVQALGTIDGAKQDLNLFSQTANKLLSSGILGRVKGYTTNVAAQILQTDPAWRQFQTLRSGIIKSIQGIASGAPGLRVTGAELAAGAEALPNSTDNLESAQTAVETFKKLLDVNRNVLLRGNATQATNTTNTGGGTGITNSKGKVISASF